MWAGSLGGRLSLVTFTVSSEPAFPMCFQLITLNLVPFESDPIDAIDGARLDCSGF